MDAIRSFFEGKVRASATTAAAVILLVQIFLPTVFDVMTGLMTVGIIWFVTKDKLKT